MRFYSLSDNPNKPCSVLQFKQVSIMLDCGLDLSSSLNFLPLPVVEKGVTLPLHNPDLVDGELRECGGSGGTVLVDSEPEFIPPQEELFCFSDIDTILISNYTCMLALPFITEKTGFRGKVYATEPSVLLGRIFMEEMLEYLGRAPRHYQATKWKTVLSQLPPPFCDLKDVRSLRTLYTKEVMEASLAKVQMVGYNEKMSIFGLLDVCPVSSGYCLGSCNWVITTGYEKIVYLSSSSTLTTHPKAMDQTSIRGADCMIMTALTQTPTQMPDPMIGEFCRIVCDTLKASGNVLVPCYPSGIIYDLFECLSTQMDMNGLTTIPMFFFSSVADSSLAYSNIMAEWLSTAKHNRVYLPEEPFVHGSLVRGGRLKSFSCLGSESVTAEYRQPCVVFTGHPSLRCGDVVHFMELWGGSANNLVVFTEPSFNHQQALAPYQPLAMKTMHCPIDTSLNFTQARKLIREAKPGCLVVPHKYTVPPTTAPTRLELVIDPDIPIFPYKKLDIIKLPVVRTLEHLELAPELAQRLVPVEVRPGVAVATVTGNLIVKDNKYTLALLEDPEEGEVQEPKRLKRDSSRGSSVPSSTTSNTTMFPLSKQKPKHYLHGSLNSTEFVSRLSSRGVTDAKVETGRDGGFPVQIHLPQEETLIQVVEDETHVLYDQVEGTPPAQTEKLREVLRETILSCVSKF